jgi:outer membrane protein insertion porin family
MKDYMKNIIRLVVLLAVLAGTVQAQFMNQTQKIENNTIGLIEVEGLTTMDAELVLDRIPLKANDNVHPLELQDKIKESIELLHESGLFSDVRVEYEYGKGNEMSFFYIVKEKRFLGKWNFEGIDELDTLDLQPGMSLSVGQPFDDADLERSRQGFLRIYKEKGFLQAQVRIREYPGESERTDVHFLVDEGDKVMVDSILMAGNDIVDSEDLLSNLASEVDRWYGEGEFKEMNLELDKDSILMVLRERGFLDSKITEARVEYLPDSTCHFYFGSSAKEMDKLNNLLTLVNTELSGETTLSLLGRKYNQISTPWMHRNQKNSLDLRQAVDDLKVDEEEVMVRFFNRIMDVSDLRNEFIDSLSLGREWKDERLTQLLSGESPLNKEYAERLTVRLMIEEMFPVEKYFEVNRSQQVRLHFAVSEGRRYYMGDVFFDGEEVYPEEVLQSRVQIEKGDVFNQRLYHATMQSIYAIYREEGYIFLQLNQDRKVQDSVINLNFSLVEGKPAHIRLVMINGNSTTQDKVIRRELKLFPGDLFRQSLMERSFRDVMQLNFFDNVLPDMKVVGDQEVDLIFDVTEKKAGTGQFSAGLSFNARDGILGNLGLSIPNCCIGDGQKADLKIEYGPYKQNYTVGFTEPWMFDKPISAGGSLNYSIYKNQTPSTRYDTLNSAYDVYDTLTRYGFSLWSGKRLTWPDDYFQIQGSYSWQNNDYSSITSPDGVIGFDGVESGVALTLSRDDKNLPIFPTEGSRYSLRVEKVGLGWDFDYWKTEFKSKWWFPLVGDVALSFEDEVGIISGNRIQERALYQMGGTMGYNGKLRGKSNGSVGKDLLGRSYFSSTLEMSWAIAPGTFYLLPIFFDVGNVFGVERGTTLTANELPDPWTEIDMSNLEKDFGFGFRVMVPMMGILGFDFAWPLDDQTGVGIMTTNFVISQGF